MRIFIIGVNGFIGSNLTRRILISTDWIVYGMDINGHYIEDFIGHERFHFTEGDVCINNEWIDYHKEMRYHHSPGGRRSTKAVCYQPAQCF